MGPSSVHSPIGLIASNCVPIDADRYAQLSLLALPPGCFICISGAVHQKPTFAKSWFLVYGPEKLVNTLSTVGLVERIHLYLLVRVVLG